MKSHTQNDQRGKTADATHADRERAGMPQAPGPERWQLIHAVADIFMVDEALAEAWLVAEFQEAPAADMKMAA